MRADMRLFFLGAGMAVSVLVGIVSIAARLQAPQALETTEVHIETTEADIEKEIYNEIEGVMRPGETMYEIFKRHGLNVQELLRIREASAGIYRLRSVSAGQRSIG